jgi:hypothetical protein
MKKKDFRIKVLKNREKKHSKRRVIREKSNDAVVRLHLSAQHAWPQFYVCLFIVCPLCISCRPQLAQLGQENQGNKRKLAPHDKARALNAEKRKQILKSN